jgi:hypothetical protein
MSGDQPMPDLSCPSGIAKPYWHFDNQIGQPSYRPDELFFRGTFNGALSISFPRKLMAQIEPWIELLQVVRDV